MERKKKDTSNNNSSENKEPIEPIPGSHIDFDIVDLGSLPKRTDNTKFHYSSFHITINTNKLPKQDPGLEARLKGFINTYFTPAHLRTIVKFVGVGGTLQDIRHMWVKYAVEVGTSKFGGRVHAHIQLTLQHVTYLHVHIDRLRGLVKRNLGITPYLHVQWISTDLPLEEYMRKSPL